MVSATKPDRYIAYRDILPIFVVTGSQTGQRLVSFEGTGFLIGKQVLVTCWHCVAQPLPENQFYAVLVRLNGGHYFASALTELEQDHNGKDLAAARVQLEPELHLALAETDAPDLVDVWSFGYPFTTLSEERPEVGRQATITAHNLIRFGPSH